MLPAGWRAPTQAGDVLSVRPDRPGLTVRIDDVERHLGPQDVGEVRLWRAADGVRRYRLADCDGTTLVLLREDDWRTPTGRLAPLLEERGWPVRTVDPPEPPHDVAPGHVRGRRPWWPVRGLVPPALHALLPLLAVGVGLVRSSGDFPGAVGPVEHVMSGFVLLTMLTTLAWWVPRRRAAPRPVAPARPGQGPRHGWRTFAGLERQGDRLVLWDGWGRVQTVGLLEAGGPDRVLVAQDAAVLVDARGRSVLRLPVDAWGGPPEALADRVAQACGLPLAVGAAPPGGEPVDDPEPPVSLVPVLGVLAVAAYGAVLVTALFAERRWDPSPVLSLLAGVGALGAAVVTVVGVVARTRLGRGRTAGRDTARGESRLLTYPLWAGFGGFLLPFAVMPSLPREAHPVWLVALAVLSLVAIPVTLRVEQGILHRYAVLVVPVLSLLVTFAGRELLRGWLLLALAVAAGSAVVVVVSGIAGARRGGAEHDGRR